MICLADFRYTNRAEFEQMGYLAGFRYTNRAEVEQMICLASFRVIKRGRRLTSRPRSFGSFFHACA